LKREGSRDVVNVAQGVDYPSKRSGGRPAVDEQAPGKREADSMNTEVQAHDKSNAPHTQSKSSLRYSNKDVEMKSNEPVIRNGAASLALSRDESASTLQQPASKHKHPNYEVYDGGSLNIGAA